MSNLVLEKLKKLPKDSGLKVNPEGTRVWLKCPFHKLSDGSQEHTQSLMINLVKNGPFNPGSGICYSCGEFVPKVEKILDPVGWRDSKGEEEVLEVVYNLYDEKTKKLLFEDEPVVNLPGTLMPWNVNDDWRTIKGKLIKMVGGQLFYDEKFQNLLLYLPCMVDGLHIGGIRANLQKRGKRNYFNTEGSWVKNNGLYPYDFTCKMIRARKLRTIVLVEGPRDALKCIQYGIPAVAILGTGNWSEQKADLLINTGVQRIITAFDPDAAGNKANGKVYASLKSEIDILRFNFHRYSSEKKMDPGNMPYKIAKKLKAYVE